jgi:hypothetical protein
MRYTIVYEKAGLFRQEFNSLAHALTAFNRLSLLVGEIKLIDDKGRTLIEIVNHKEE